jgi:tRNA nucleotidyltransferase (CCA-adding enzyme)
VSEAFAEDPLRVLRVARFAAKFHHLGFKIAEETQQLMQHIVATKEICELSAERIWQETHKALCTTSPEQFFLILHRVNALAQTHPSISREFAKQNSRGAALAALSKIVTDETDACVRLAAFIGGLYYQDAEKGYQDTQAFCEQLILPKTCKELLLLTVSLQHQCDKVFEFDEKQLLDLLRSMDVKRKAKRFKKLLKIFSAIHHSISLSGNYPQADFLQQAAVEIENIDMESLVTANIAHQKLANKIRQAQQTQLKELIQKRQS